MTDRTRLARRLAFLFVIGSIFSLFGAVTYVIASLGRLYYEYTGSPDVLA